MQLLELIEILKTKLQKIGIASASESRGTVKKHNYYGNCFYCLKNYPHESLYWEINKQY